MNILAIDSSTEACSAALLRDDGQVFDEFEIAPRQHTRLLAAMMDSLLKASGLSKASLTHCAFANGPGAFTGIRIAAATAQGIGLGLGIPLAQISTLATLAQTCFDKHESDDCLVALDARMGEVYWARYRRARGDLAELQGSEKLSRLDAVELESLPACGAGHGWKLMQKTWLEGFPDNDSILLDSELLPRASSMLKLAHRAIADDRLVTAESIGINYLRNRVAEKPRS